MKNSDLNYPLSFIKVSSFIIALLATYSPAQAQVTFDFTGEEAYKQFGFAGFSSNESHDGDFTEDCSLTFDDVTITVSPSEKTTANRFWSGSLRLYGGTLTISSSGENISSIQFELNHTNWGVGNAADSGTLETGKWTGDAASVVITIAANTQIRKMKVYMGDGGDTPDPQPEEIDWTSSADTPLTVAAMLEKAAKLEQGQNSNKEVFVKGKISSIRYNFDAEHGVATFSISDDGLVENEFLCYGTYYLGNRAWVEGDSLINVGDDVIVYGTVTNYNGTPEMASKKNYLYSLHGKTDGGETPDPQPEEIDWTSSADTPLTVAAMLEKAAKLEQGQNSNKEVFVKGKISSIRYNFDAEHGVATFSISDDGLAENEFLCYGTYYLGNRAWVEGDSLINVGDDVIVYGTVTNYNGTPEMASRNNYLYSLNGKTEGGDTPDLYTTVGDGSWEKPYTVEDILHVGTEKENGPKGWVHAYIVGYINGTNIYTGSVFYYNSDTNPLTPPNNNILIAAAPEVTDPAQCVPVQLANQLGMREELSLYDHPENLGKEIWLHGEFIKYFNVAGVKNIDEWKWEGWKDEDDLVTLTANSYFVEYGEPIPRLEITKEGTAIEGEPAITCEAVQGSPVGTYPIIISKGGITNDNVNYINGTLTITKAPLIITVGNATKKQGESMPEFTVNYKGFKNGETEDVLTTLPTVTCEATTDSPKGSYEIMVSGAEAQNYVISYINGTLTVEDADCVTFTAKDYTVEYGEPLPSFGYDFTTEGIGQNGEPSITCEAVQGSPVGTYPIVITKGTVGNYNDYYVNGSLTITKAPLTVSVGNYTRNEREDNPDFILTYSRWKMNDNESVLTMKPVATTTATAESVPGEYPITVSGGEAQNYEITYIGGTLTVEKLISHKAIIFSMGNGTVTCHDAVTDKDVTIGDMESKEIQFFQQYGLDLFILPEQGYQLQRMRVNNTERADEVDEAGRIHLDAENDMNVMVHFKEQEEVVFSQDGANIHIPNLSNNEAEVQGVSKTATHVTIPSTIEYRGRTWRVTKVEDGAFASCPNLVSVSIPVSVKEVGAGLFEGDTHLAAIEWNAEIPLTRTVLGILRNPNLLYYVRNKELAEGFSNVITGSDESGWVAEHILLSDNDNATHDFYAPKSFTARRISYTHAYLQETNKGECRGWESIALPFDVQTIIHQKGEIQPFKAYHLNAEDALPDSYLPFWLYEYTEDGSFRPAEAVKANTPYILSMPNDDHYDLHYDLSGSVTFSAENAEVKASEDAITVMGNGRTFCPAYQERLTGEGCYVLNLSKTYAGHVEGSIFVRNLRDVRPFEAYFTVDGEAVKEDFFSVFDSTTEIEEVKSKRVKSEEGAGAVYDLGGRMISVSSASSVLPKGVYIVKGQKVVVN